MTDVKETTTKEVKTEAPKAADKKPFVKRTGGTFGGHKKNERPRRPRRGGRRDERKEFDQKIVSIRRVTRVVSGGRRFSFSVVIVIGDRKGKVGVGVGKASDTALAIEKAIRDAKKNMIKVRRQRITVSRTILTQSTVHQQLLFYQHLEKVLLLEVQLEQF